MTIGVYYDNAYAVEETFQLFKIPWEWYDPSHTYDVVIARKGEVDTAGAYLVDLSEKDYFAEIARTLNEGLPHCHEPVVEVLIDELRQVLKEHTLLVEIPPVPWGYSYIVALTHDVDITSVRERRWVSVGYAVYQCLRKGMVRDALQILGAKCGVGKDPWHCFEEWMRLEENLGVRSTWFFLPFKGKAGEGAPAIRAGYYDLDPDLIQRLTDGGWEVGVHGLDNWRDDGAAREELRRVTDLTGVEGGTRVHWLLFDADSWKILDEAGYAYDSTFGYNDDVGFRAGTMQPYRPRGCGRLLEVPLIIQDGGLFGGKTWNSSDDGGRGACLRLSEEAGMRRCEEVLAYAKQYGGVVTLLWHQVSMAAPKNWGGFYQALVERAVADGAWVAPVKEAVRWFTARSYFVLHTERVPEGLRIRLSGTGPDPSLPLMRIRVHTDAVNLGKITGDYIEGAGYVDLQYSSPEILVKVHEGTAD
ncbi:MAG: polysaccharide deacetylase family protein [Methanofollis sp.]|jgi:hypothetical protein|uniref:polysaccharide deacetylase family protein n=1 Tax=Methanofollis sp. TaxID=2052835 RepID=UPI002639300C|nr:polysaccharide deacetylase family protein [Methanofollis sp.]MDD4255678.1 polysaccharide deacetylase family protein [Methanofollis sp.]